MVQVILGLEVIILSWLLWKSWFLSHISRVLVISITIYVLLWCIIPITTNLFFWDKLLPAPFTTRENYINMAAIELGGITIICFFFILLEDITWRKRSHFPSNHTSFDRLERTLLVLSALTVFTATVFDPMGGMSYLERNLVTNIEEAKLNPVFNTIWMFKPFASAFLFAYVVMDTKGITRAYLFRFLAWTLIVFDAGYALLLGSRISLITPLLISLLSVVRHKTQHLKRMLVVLALGSLTIIFGGLWLHIVGDLRSSGHYEAKELYNAISRENMSEAISLLGVNMIMKLDSIQSGAVLVDEHGMGMAGYQPYMGAVFALVPRTLWPRKPEPGSFDGALMGHPSRVAAALTGMDVFVGNVGVSPGAISIWQFGYFGLMPWIILNALNLWFLNRLLLAHSLVRNSLGFYLLGLPTLVTLFASADVLILNAQRVCLCLAIILICSKIKWTKMSFTKSNAVSTEQES